MTPHTVWLLLERSAWATRPADIADRVTVEYDADIEGPLALSILVDHDTWEAVEYANTFYLGCEVSAPYSPACELEPVLSYWN